MTDRFAALARNTRPMVMRPESFALARKRLDVAHAHCGCTNLDPCEPLHTLAFLYEVIDEAVTVSLTRMVG